MKSVYSNDEALMKFSPDSNSNPSRQYYKQCYTHSSATVNSAIFTFLRAKIELKPGGKNKR